MNRDKLHQLLTQLYEAEPLAEALELFDELFIKYEQEVFPQPAKLTQENVCLITYGDSFLNSGQRPLQALKDVMDHTLKETFTDIHLLPMFPYTSDDGFAITDYMTINPELGDWADIQALADDYRLMFDFVANHLSKSSVWFTKFLNEEANYEHAFVTEEAGFDTQNVIRPRTTPLFHTYKKTNGKAVNVWTTFSEDQVDVNVKDPKTLMRLTDVLLAYSQRGASSIRLDAIGFLWKSSGTTSMHLPQTHQIIQLWRELLDHFAPNTQIITETNVPHADNISYFGNGHNEAHQVYQFPLPPLVLHTFVTGDSSKLNQWAHNIHPVSAEATYFNFLASHDGIGLRPTEGILSDEERKALVQRVVENGGKISFKNNPDGRQSVYEMNINYGEALRDPNAPEMTEKRMIAAHHILLSFVGVPAIYYHSIFGSKNDLKGLQDSGINRRINREKLDKNKLLQELDTNVYRKDIYTNICNMLAIRKQEPAFDPFAEQEVLELGSGVFALRRFSATGECVLAITNITGAKSIIQGIYGHELISNQTLVGKLELEPYGIAWVKEGECNESLSSD